MHWTTPERKAVVAQAHALHDAQAGIEPAFRGYLIGNGKPDFKQLGKRGDLPAARSGAAACEIAP
jgi:hypothetical protein